MAICDCCGNAYDKAFIIEKDGHRYTFDAFECAIHHLAPTCPQCGCRVMDGVEADGTVYCCAHCAHAAGFTGTIDRV